MRGIKRAAAVLKAWKLYNGFNNCDANSIETGRNAWTQYFTAILCPSLGRILRTSRSNKPIFIYCPLHAIYGEYGAAQSFYFIVIRVRPWQCKPNRFACVCLCASNHQCVSSSVSGRWLMRAFAGNIRCHRSRWIDDARCDSHSYVYRFPFCRAF